MRPKYSIFFNGLADKEATIFHKALILHDKMANYRKYRGRARAECRSKNAIFANPLKSLTYKGRSRVTCWNITRISISRIPLYFLYL